MLKVPAVPVTPDAFSPYGAVLSAAGDAQRICNLRPDAQLSVEIVEAPLSLAVAEVRELERHPKSGQAFFPIEGMPYLIVVCATTPENAPDLADLKAFVVPGDTAIQYAQGTWHAPIRALGRTARLGMVVHKTGSSDDCELVPVQPFHVTHSEDETLAGASR